VSNQEANGAHGGVRRAWVVLETLSGAQNGRDGERVTQGVELWKGGARKKICLRFRGLKEDMTQGEAGGEMWFQTVYLRRIMG
jgi:hypothetical protein